MIWGRTIMDRSIYCQIRPWYSHPNLYYVTFLLQPFTPWKNIRTSFSRIKSAHPWVVSIQGIFVYKLFYSGPLLQFSQLQLNPTSLHICPITTTFLHKVANHHTFPWVWLIIHTKRHVTKTHFLLYGYDRTSRHVYKGLQLMTVVCGWSESVWLDGGAGWCCTPVVHC